MSSYTRLREIGIRRIGVVMSSLGMTKPKSNLPTERLRWSLYRAAIEFNSTEPTLLKRLEEAKEVADPETHTYSTLQILRALAGGSKALRDREIKERGDNWALKNDALRKEYLPAKEVFRVLEAVFGAMKSDILGTAELPEHLARSLLTRLSEIDPSQFDMP
jgi:hypothetical protein